MIDKLPLSGAMAGQRDEKFWENALYLTSKRLELLASNIANADTPNYKARDIDFKAALQASLATSSKLEPEKKGLAGDVAAKPAFTPLYRVPVQGSVDGNTVDMDVERNAFTKNAILYEFALQKAVGQYKEISELFKTMVG